MDLFYVNTSLGIKKTYHDFIVDLSSIREKGDYIYSKNPYDVFLKITHAIVNNYQVELLDGDFSELELANIGLALCDVRRVEAFDSFQLEGVKQLIALLRRLNFDFGLTLYTSGTTGQPKKVNQTLEALTRNVKVSERFSINVWGLAYNPTHMAGLQVFFQALFNQNVMVDLFGSNMKDAPRLVEEYLITNISATATYYRYFLSMVRKGDAFPSVRGVTFGGEKYDESLEQGIREVFPNSRVRNIYASTEAGSLFTAAGDIFSIGESLNDRFMISEENELLLHKSLLGFGIAGDWYNTGDLVEKAGENGFRFVSRQSEMINVGGYKVNPHEVEKVLTGLDFVSDALVKARDNKVTGKIIVADVVLAKNVAGAEVEVGANAEDRALGMSEAAVKKKIKDELGAKLQPFKIPRIIKIVDRIEQTRTGKKVRK